MQIITEILITILLLISIVQKTSSICCECTTPLTECKDIACIDIVCAPPPNGNPLCCKQRDLSWDNTCAQQAQDVCGFDTTAPPTKSETTLPPKTETPFTTNPSGLCCACANQNAQTQVTGCSDDKQCQDIICANIDDYCCVFEWDNSCSATANQICNNNFTSPNTTAVMSPTSSPIIIDIPIGTCCTVDKPCKNTICIIDDYCCNFGWDSICDELAQDVCYAHSNTHANVTNIPTTTTVIVEPPTTYLPSSIPTDTPRPTRNIKPELTTTLLSKNPTNNPLHLPTSEPTPEPTPKPTRIPTPNPTTYPTDFPIFITTTTEPTPLPTDFPTSLTTTLEPTPLPTDFPTDQPTSEPTQKPSHIPIFIPTHEPTPEPTQKPSHIPIFIPTHEPTPEPTPKPTLITATTLEPTPNPTPNPTVKPTDIPTNMPILDTTPEPTPEPTPNPQIEFSTTGIPTFRPIPEETYRPTPEPNSQTEFPTIGGNIPTFRPIPEETYRPTPEPNPQTEFPTTGANIPTFITIPEPTYRPTPEPFDNVCCDCVYTSKWKQRGCDDSECEAIICELDAFCCWRKWDYSCVVKAEAICYGNEIPKCCYCTSENRQTIGCEQDIECEIEICNNDSFCCNRYWDGECANQATKICTQSNNQENVWTKWG